MAFIMIKLSKQSAIIHEILNRRRLRNTFRKNSVLITSQNKFISIINRVSLGIYNLHIQPESNIKQIYKILNKSAHYWLYSLIKDSHETNKAVIACQGSRKRFIKSTNWRCNEKQCFSGTKCQWRICNIDITTFAAILYSSINCFVNLK